MDEKLIINNASFLDIEKGKFIENQTILIENGKFKEISNEMQAVSEIKNIDANGKFVLPGLIDCHVHVEMQMGLNYDRDYVRTKSGKYYYYALVNSQKHLKAGFTTLRDCGSWEKWGPALREVFSEKIIYGPRLVLANRPINQFGDQEGSGPDDLIEAELKHMVPTGIEGVMHAVRQRKHSGADFIKTMTTGGVLHGQESQLTRSLWRDEEIEAIVSEAHRLGMHVAVHAHGLEGIYRAVKAGVDSIEHCSFVDEETADLMVAKGTYLVPTQTSAFIDNEEVMASLPPEVVIKTTEVDLAMFKNHKLAFEKGVKIAMGTDAGVPGNPHGTSAREISSYVDKIGMTPMQAIQSATIEAAKAIKRDHQIGSIEVGKYADLIIVNENPLENIKMLEDTNNIDFVVKDGIIMSRNGNLTQK